MNYTTLSRLISEAQNDRTLIIVDERKCASHDAGILSDEEMYDLDYQITRRFAALEG